MQYCTFSTPYTRFFTVRSYCYSYLRPSFRVSLSPTPPHTRFGGLTILYSTHRYHTNPYKRRSIIPDRQDSSAEVGYTKDKTRERHLLSFAIMDPPQPRRRPMPSTKMPSARYSQPNRLSSSSIHHEQNIKGRHLTGSFSTENRLGGVGVTKEEADNILLALAQQDEDTKKTWSRLVVERYLSKVWEPFRASMRPCIDFSYIALLVWFSILCSHRSSRCGLSS